MSVYMFMPLWPVWQGEESGTALDESGAMVALFGLGLFLPGPFCNYWLDTYKRKTICLWAMLAVMAATFVLSFPGLPTGLPAVLRLLQGMAFGVFQIALGSTLLIDLSHTRRRTQAAHVYYWFSRFAWSLGPAAGWLAIRCGMANVMVSMACVAVTAALVLDRKSVV